MTNSTSEAFDLLVTEMEEAIEVVRSKAHGALDAGRFAEAQSLAQQAQDMEAAVHKVGGLKAEWARLVVPPRRPGGGAPGGRRSYGRLPGGTKTPDHAFRVPILRALEDLGGRGRVAEVLDRVRGLMGSSLRPIDLQPLPSNPRQPRWRNTAQWERLTMVEEGLLAANSPRGVWEITAEGRRLLAAGGGRP